MTKTETKFTTGEWQMSILPIRDSFGAFQRTIFVINALQQKRQIATICSVDKEINDANARLIAAAPDMLAALQEAADMLGTIRPIQFEEDEGLEDGSVMSVFAKVNSAIKKATS